MKHIISFSGGKDSTAMSLRLIEENYPVDEIVFFDTGWEFPQIHDHIKKFEQYTERKVTVLHPKKSFEHWMLHQKVIGRTGENNGIFYRTGCGWPSPSRRWCTREKVSTIDTYCGKNALMYIGLAADEKHRTYSSSSKKKRYEIKYPLIDWEMSESDCLQYCYNRGFDWDGLYKIFRRVSCFCCPLQSLNALRTLRKNFPNFWKQMIEYDKTIQNNRGFNHNKTICDLEKQFCSEEEQEELFP
jgi:3'-phosphoadenosine 5'-phosphosulfate sulfotransferase (PAPS reductase)/FAD synthetase